MSLPDCPLCGRRVVSRVGKSVYRKGYRDGHLARRPRSRSADYVKGYAAGERRRLRELGESKASREDA